MKNTRYRNQRDNQSQNRLPLFQVWAAIFLSSLSKVRLINNFFKNSTGVLNGRVISCFEKGEYEEALRLSLDGLDKVKNKAGRRFSKFDHHKWWTFMRFAVDCVRLSGNSSRKDDLIKAAAEGIQPLKGNDVSYCYLIFSGWMFETEDYDRAFEFIDVSSEADCNWGDPDYLNGWYRLKLNREEAGMYLRRAIQKEPKIYTRIVKDDLFRKHPNIIQELEEAYSETIGSNNRSKLSIVVF